MIGLLCFVLAVLASPFKSKLRLEAENAVLRHQLIVLRRRLHGRVRLTNHDRWFFIQLYRWFPSILKVLTIIRPERLVRWHRAGFRCYWRWKSCPLGGRPQIETKLRVLIRRMSVENPLWGAPRIVRCPDYRFRPALCLRHRPAGPQRTHLDQRHGKSDGRMGCGSNHGGFPWDEAPHYLIRDRDRIYGSVVTRRLRAMGIRDKPTASASRWQNGFAERLIGSIRRECVDHIIVLGEAHLRRILKSYAKYYNRVRTHRSLNKDAPVSRPVQRTGVIRARAILGGLHHRYARV